MATPIGSLKLITATSKLSKCRLGKGAKRRAHAIRVRVALLSPPYEDSLLPHPLGPYPPPAHIQRLPSHERRVVAGEKRQHADQIVRHLHALDRL